ncbi:hypothetical protein [Methylomicrobium sp. Wu6]|uniref:hypothetical protein n=1 Tax=Methylomicrobium sp. Wu6 TaxID=3107928 RepID=UPI002DD69F66|nr:hypothetical protein [Methylomicrobium sp. Wu6]MEC4748273.1 hypothetical protein [Methylomicrobium sp. Wu6]
MTQAKDSIYASPLGDIEALKFDEKVAAVFPNISQRKVRGYQAIIATTGLLAGDFTRTDNRTFRPTCITLLNGHRATAISKSAKSLVRSKPDAAARKSGFNLLTSTRPWS